MGRIKRTLLYLILTLPAVPCLAQKEVSLQESEQLFQKNNLFLLASHYEIDAATARIIQARLWENPWIFGEVNAINPQDGNVFDAGRKGQKVFAIEQLIYLGGKKKNEVALAKSSAELAQLEFLDLLRRLKYELRVTFFSIYYDRLSLSNLEKQLNNLQSLLSAYQEQAEKGNVPYKDIVRLQSLYLQLQNEKITVQNRILTQEKDLKILLGSEETFIPLPSDSELESCTRAVNLSLDSLQSMAINNRPDILAARKRIETAQWNLKWQKSLAVPDLLLGANYDQRGGAFNDQINITLGIPLPLINRNQGNIKIADAYVSQSKVLMEQQLLEANTEVKLAYEKYLNALKNFQNLNTEMDKNLETVYQGILLNFQRRNISILDFTDFMESYNSSILQMYGIRKDLREACEGINMLTVHNIF